MVALAAAVPPVEGPCLADEPADRDDGVGKVEECADDGECHNLSLAGAASLPSTEPRHTPSHSHGGIVITYRPPVRIGHRPSGHQLAVNWRAGPRRQGSSRIRPGVAAAPAAAPPAAPDRAGTRVQMRIGTVAAARAGRGHRPAGIGVGSRRPAEAIAIGHGNLLVITALTWGTANCAEGTRPLVTDGPLTLSRAGAKVTWRPANGPATASWRIRHTGGSAGGLPEPAVQQREQQRHRTALAPAAPRRTRKPKPGRRNGRTWTTHGMGEPVS